MDAQNYHPVMSAEKMDIPLQNASKIPTDRVREGVDIVGKVEDNQGMTHRRQKWWKSQ